MIFIHISNIRKEKCRPATPTPTPVYVTLRLPPLDSEWRCKVGCMEVSNIRKEKCRPATTPTPVYVTLRLPPLYSETGWTGELWSNPVLLILEN